MKRNYQKLFFSVVLFLGCGSVQVVFAQGFGSPLTMQGVDQFNIQSAASKAMGGTSLGVLNNASVMFTNPALLQSLQGLQISVGGVQQNVRAYQTQHYSPLKYYSNFSLLMEGLTDGISDPDTNSFYINSNGDSVKYVSPGNPGDSVQRPFDKIGPNWNRSSSRSNPLQLAAAVPFSIGDMKISAGIGTMEYANLNWYFQNNNILSPSILTANAYTVSRPINDNDTSSIPVQWSQYYQERKGIIQGYGGALAFNLSDRMVFGISTMMLVGSSDDKEVRVNRGRLRFYANYFRAESVYYHSTRIGT